jgi:hypothetical protein
MPAAEMDERTDTYALGCVLHEMLTRRAPFHAHNTAGWMKQHLEEAPQPPSQWRRDLADWVGLDELVLRMLAKNREDRPRDAELLNMLDAVHRGPGEVKRETVVEVVRKRPETVVEEAKGRPETIRETSAPAPPQTPELSSRPAGPEIAEDAASAVVSDGEKQKPTPRRERRKVVLIVAAVVVILLASAIYIATEMLYPISFSDASRIEADEAAALKSIHAINDAEEKYKAMYPDVGYADSLAKLGGYRILGHPTANAAQLLPGDLAAGYSKGYIFTMNCMNTWSQSAGSRVGGCNLYAYPRIAGKTGSRGFCMLWGYGFWVDPKVNPARGAQCSQRLK